MNKFLIIGLIVGALIIVVLGFLLITGGSGLSGPELGTKTTTIQGMKVTTLKEGSGPEAKNGDRLSFHYIGTLADGTKFDSSIDRNAPYPLTLVNGTLRSGAGGVIKGWDLGLVGMKVGEKRKLVIPPELAYGERGFPPIIPANATLIFEVELMAIN
jgi:FKBP-type peptidyl-prolyl cis-trans isomerase